LKTSRDPSAGDLCGVVVTYHPDETVADNLRAMVRECGRVVVVDNGSSEEARRRIAAIAGVELLSLGENLGVATALNRGAARALENGCEWIVTFDQDSRPQLGMVAAMWATHCAVPLAAVIGPRIHTAGRDAARFWWVRQHPRWPGLFQRIGCTDCDLEVTMLITSGSLMELALWQKLGGFDEALFIDYIDIDYCLRVIQACRLVAVSAGAMLDHRLGESKNRQFMGREVHLIHHAAFRHYTIARNRMRVWRRHALAVPHWALFDLCSAGWNTFRVLVLEPQKWSKLKAMFLGTWDGLCGRSGPCPVYRRKALQP
jgi:rhamnosyltransferase